MWTFELFKFGKSVETNVGYSTCYEVCYMHGVVKVPKNCSFVFYSVEEERPLIMFILTINKLKKIQIKLETKK